VKILSTVSKLQETMRCVWYPDLPVRCEDTVDSLQTSVVAFRNNGLENGCCLVRKKIIYKGSEDRRKFIVCAVGLMEDLCSKPGFSVRRFFEAGIWLSSAL
jgi:hypothetical protein